MWCCRQAHDAAAICVGHGGPCSLPAWTCRAVVSVEIWHARVEDLHSFPSPQVLQHASKPPAEAACDAAGEHMTRQQFVWSTGGMLIAGLDSQGLTLSFTLCVQLITWQ